MDFVPGRLLAGLIYAGLFVALAALFATVSVIATAALCWICRRIQQWIGDNFVFSRDVVIRGWRTIPSP